MLTGYKYLDFVWNGVKMIFIRLLKASNTSFRRRDHTREMVSQDIVMSCLISLCQQGGKATHGQIIKMQ